MAHLVRTLTDAQLRRGLVLTGTHLAGIDENTKKALDGKAGGAYTPSSPMVVGGPGMVAAGAWTFSGGALVDVDGASSSSTIAFGANGAAEAFQYGPAHAEASRTLLSAITEPYTPLVKDAFSGSTFGCVRTVTPGVRFLCPLRVHGQGAIDSVTFRFRIGSAHANVPAVMPQVRVVRVSTEGVFEALRAADLSTTPEGFVAVPRPASGALYYDSGNAKSLVYECNQNETVDKASFLYFGEIIEESGTNAYSAGLSTGNLWVSMACAQSGITMLSNRH